MTRVMVDDVIAALQRVKATHGNIEVLVHDSGESGSYYTIEEIASAHFEGKVVLRISSWIVQG